MSPNNVNDFSVTAMKFLSEDLVVFFGDISFISSIIAVIVAAMILVIKHILENDYDFMLPKILYVLFNFIFSGAISFLIICLISSRYVINYPLYYLSVVWLCSFLIEFLFYLIFVKSFVSIKDIIINFFRLKKMMSDIDIMRAKVEMQDAVNDLQDEIAEYEAIVNIKRSKE